MNILSLLIGLVIIIPICFKGMHQAFVVHSKLLGSTRLYGAKSLASEVLLSRADCQSTMAQCPVSGPVQVVGQNLDGTPKILVSNGPPYTKLHGFTLKAQCNSANGIDVRVASLKPRGNLSSTNAGDFFPYGPKKKPLTWTNPDGLLLPSEISLCSAFERPTDWYNPKDFYLYAGTLPGSLTPEPGAVINTLRRGDDINKAYLTVNDYGYCFISKRQSNTYSQYGGDYDIMPVRTYGKWRLYAGSRNPAWGHHRFTCFPYLK